MVINENKLKILFQKVLAFNKARGWKPTASDLAKSIVIESAELLEHFQWDESDKIERRNALKNKNWQEIRFEVADILWYLINFCEKNHISIEDALEEKLIHNEKKYPSEKFQGKHNDKFYKKQKKAYRAKKK